MDLSQERLRDEWTSAFSTQDPNKIKYIYILLRYYLFIIYSKAPYSRMLRHVGNNEVKRISINHSASSCDTIHVFALKDCKIRRKTSVSAVIILSANVHVKIPRPLIYVNVMPSMTSGSLSPKEWHVLKLRVEERPPVWRVAVNILNKQSRTCGKGWFPGLRLRNRLIAPHRKKKYHITMHSQLPWA